MVDVVNISAYTAGWAMEAVKQPARTPTSIVAKEERRREVRLERDGDDEDIESALPAIQSAAVSLDLLTQDNRDHHPELQRVIDAYAENA